MTLTMVTILIGGFCSWALADWLQPTIPAGIAIGALVGMVCATWWRALR